MRLNAQKKKEKRKKQWMYTHTQKMGPNQHRKWCAMSFGLRQQNNKLLELTIECTKNKRYNARYQVKTAKHIFEWIIWKCTQLTRSTRYTKHKQTRISLTHKSNEMERKWANEWKKTNNFHKNKAGRDRAIWPTQLGNGFTHFFVMIYDLLFRELQWIKLEIVFFVEQWKFVGDEVNRDWNECRDPIMLPYGKAQMVAFEFIVVHCTLYIVHVCSMFECVFSSDCIIEWPILA